VPLRVPRFHSFMLLLGAGAAWAATTAVPLRAQTAGRPSALGTARLQGIVADGVTGEPLKGVGVELTRLSTGRVWRASVGADGWFALASLGSGIYAIQARRLGYEPFVDTLALEAGREHAVTLSLIPAPFRLRPLVVSAARRARPGLEDFERRRALGFGSFVTRADIEDRHPHLVTDLFRGMAGVRVALDRRGDGHVLVRGTCRPRLYLDGLAVDDSSSPDLFLRPDDVEGIEVYSTATVPPQYARSACGAVLIWTRVPERLEGHGPWWRGLAVGGAFLAIWGLTH